ncbi:hypothetical protein GCM10011415_03340 [Salipiger pallidus]|uniref:Type IV pilus biogenesis n=1 Tax=Salipiger pallidus TaxID=1775170 RepID=A0A8J3EES2_9RHOB|nr:amidophosphoribosyltransferase [Salipiger pallidus]GGG60695.1 hypothetical protein GCM10011415_03340 [Salipiger pallidus]
MAQELTPSNVAKTATRSADIPRRGIVLLGIYGSEEAPSVLFRTPGGKTGSARIGERIAGLRIVAVDDGRVALANGKTAHWVSVPGND